MVNFAYWHWLNNIPSETCQKLIDLGEERWDQAEIFGSIDKKLSLGDIRKSDIVWVQDQWVYDLIWDYMLSANENAGWKYNIVAAEACQITRYTKDGFYNWHTDGTGSHPETFNRPEDKFLHGNTRKLSMSIVLNDEYEGGDFEIFNLRPESEVPRLQEGSIIVFPSFMEHRVTPVTKGTRYSLVAWFVGPPFV